MSKGMFDKRRPSVAVAKRIATVLGFEWTRFFEEPGEQEGSEKMAKLRFDLPPLEYERQMHRYWYGRFRIVMTVNGFLAAPYIAGIVTLICASIKQ